jgi:FdhE protein
MPKETMQQTLVNFYTSISQVSLPEKSINFTPPAPEIINYGQEKGIPLLNICPPQVKSDDFYTLLIRIGEIIQEHYPSLTEECKQIYAALPADAAGRELFVNRAFTPGENLIANIQQDVSPETFGFLLTHTIRPFMRQYGKIASALYNLEAWLRGYCPVCGGKPSLSLLEKEQGRRYLYCGLCEIKWRFQRLGCPYCLTGESQFFTVEGEEKYRVYFCENCRGYLKLIDEKKSDSEVNLFWEDINTVYLDILALQEGYLNKPA